MIYHRGRLLDHLHVRVRNFDRAGPFYLALFEALGLGAAVRGGRDWIEIDELYLDEASASEVPTAIHLCFQAADDETVRRFHAAGLAAGGRCNGPPQIRDYHTGYYSAYLLDPDSNSIEAKCDGRIRMRSAASVTIET